MRNITSPRTVSFEEALRNLASRLPLMWTVWRRL